MGNTYEFYQLRRQAAPLLESLPGGGAGLRARAPCPGWLADVLLADR